MDEGLSDPEPPLRDEVERVHKEESARIERLIRFKDDNPNVECILEASRKNLAWAEGWLAAWK